MTTKEGESIRSGRKLAEKHKHPFGELLTQYRTRKPGLTQTRLAELAGYDQAILVRMTQGKKDLTGPSGRDRVLRLIGVLHEAGALTALDEANILLAASSMPPLYDGLPNEAALLKLLAPSRVHSGIGTAPSTGDGIRYQPPAPVTPLIGRVAELRALSKLLNAARLVTLTGAGGSGKTRLALEVSARQCKMFDHGACFVSLAPVMDSSEVISAVAQALQVREMPGQTTQEGVKRFLQSKSLLLVLDNFEHVLEAAPVITELLADCQGLHMLCTSREALRVYGEHRFALQPLAANDAVALLVERAQAVEHDFALTHGNASTLDAICRQVDRLPLAIELAAARINELGPAALLAKLAPSATSDPPDGQGARLDVLSDGPRDVHARQKTLRNTIDWSYDSLTELEQIVFRRLGVFVGGWELEQAEQVVNDAAGQSDVLPLLTQLVSKSLAVAGERDGATRYHLLETIREYALEKLRECGETDMVTRRHANAFVHLADQAYVGVQSHDQRRWFDRLEREHPNLSAALHWSFSPAGDPILGCHMVSALQLPWRNATSHQKDIWRWLQIAADALTDDMPARVHGGVWLGQTWLKVAFTSAEALPRLQKALAYYEVAGDVRGIADAKGQVGICMSMNQPDDPAGLQMLEDAISLSKSLGNKMMEHSQIKGLAWLFNIRKEFDKAEALRLDAIASCRRTGDLVNLTLLLYEHGNQLLELARLDEALTYGEESAHIAQQINDPRTEMYARGIVSEAVRYLGDLPRAVALNEALLAFTRERLAPLDVWLPILLTAKSLNDVGNHGRAQLLLSELATLLNATYGATRGYYGHLFDAAACTASGQGDARRAAQLFGAADAEMAAVNERRFQNNDIEIAPYIAKARAALGDEAYAEGRAMTLERAIEVALIR